MKKILVFSHALELGGAETALLGLLEKIDTTKYDIDLFLMRHKGDLMDYIPNVVNLLPEISEYSMLAVPFANVIKAGYIGIALGRYAGKRNAINYAKKHNHSDSMVEIEYSHKYTKKYMPKLPGKYDVAISFLTPHYLVADKVEAKKKIAWIHTDYSKIDIDVESELKMWDAYDEIVAISEEAKAAFGKTFPLLKNKITVVENILPENYITKKSAEESNATIEMQKTDSIKLLTIGRFSYAKRMDEIPAITKKILESGVDITWYLVGFGGDEALIRQKIEEAGMQEHVIILGKKTNPYPYIKACDFYVQPSRYEGKSVAVREAQTLCKPVIITAYPTASSQLEDGVDGVIVPMDIDGCAKGIADVLRDENLKAHLVEEISKRDYSNSSEIEKVYSLLDKIKPIEYNT